MLHDSQNTQKYAKCNFVDTVATAVKLVLNELFFRPDYSEDTKSYGSLPHSPSKNFNRVRKANATSRPSNDQRERN